MAVERRCPRCGYDQSGAIAAWERSEPAQCPLRGTCTECGEEFEWGRVFKPDQRWPIVPIERAEHRLIASALVTVWRALRPWSFWRWTDPHTAPRWSRVLPCVLVGTVLVHSIGVLLYAGAGQLALWIDPPPGWGLYNCHTTGGLRGDIWVGLWPWGQPPGIDMPAEYAQPAFSPASVMAFIVIAFFTTCVMAVSVGRRRELPIRQARIAAYGLIGATLPHVLTLACASGLAVVEAIETRLLRHPEASWKVRTFFFEFGDYVSIALAIGWWMAWWGCAGAGCLNWRRPWLTVIAVAALSCLCTMLVFVSAEPLWVWTGKFWKP